MARRTIQLTRRPLLGSAAAVAATVLGGCSWTPRSEAAAGGEAAATAPTSAGTPDDGLVDIAGGTFLMGSPSDEPWRSADETQHEVTVSDFSLDPHEVTQADYARLMGENPSSTQGDTLPVESVTWLDAVAYCNARSEEAGLAPAYVIDGEAVTWDRAADGYRLPTEAEWEYACRAGTTTPFNTRTSISPDTEANYYGTYPYQIEDNYFDRDGLETQPGTYRQRPIEPGSFAANAWGLFDMHGNVAEWVWDRYGAYPEGAGVRPGGPRGGRPARLPWRRVERLCQEPPQCLPRVAAAGRLQPERGLPGGARRAGRSAGRRRRGGVRAGGGWRGRDRLLQLERQHA